MGQDTNDLLGYSVNRAGDINGDGIDDIMIGAYRANPFGRAQAGTTYIIYGKKDGSPDIKLSLLTIDQGFKVMGANIQDSIGASVTSGDVNGDGGIDLILGASSKDAAG